MGWTSIGVPAAVFAYGEPVYALYTGGVDWGAQCGQCLPAGFSPPMISGLLLVGALMAIIFTGWSYLAHITSTT